MWTELWATCAQKYHMPCVFFKNHKILLHLPEKSGKKEPGVVLGTAALESVSREAYNGMEGRGTEFTGFQYTTLRKGTKS